MESSIKGVRFNPVRATIATAQKAKPSAKIGPDASFTAITSFQSINNLCKLFL